MGLFSFISDLLPVDQDAIFEITPIVRPASVPTAPARSFALDWPAQAPSWRPNGKEFFTDALYSSLGSTAGEITAICGARR